MTGATTTRSKTMTVAAIVAACLVLAALAAACDRSGDRVTGPSSSATTTAPAIEQARWDFDVRPTAALSKRFGKKDRKRLLRQRGPLKRTVKEVYDALFLDPSNARSVIARRFVGRASTALLRARAGVGPNAAEVKTLKRYAAIGIDAVSGKRAAARVFIRARASVDGKRLRMKHRSTLWLERIGGRWVAIGFQVKQEPVA